MYLIVLVLVLSAQAPCDATETGELLKERIAAQKAPQYDSIYTEISARHSLRPKEASFVGDQEFVECGLQSPDFLFQSQYGLAAACQIPNAPLLLHIQRRLECRFRGEVSNHGF